MLKAVFHGIKLFFAKTLSYIVDCRLVSYMPLTVLAVNHFSMSSGGNAKSPIFWPVY